MKNQNKFYVFEGDNGVGKSSVIMGLNGSIPIKRISTPTAEFRRIRDYVHKRGSKYVSFFFYLSSVFDASQEVKDCLASPERSIAVCDRYIVSTLASFGAVSEWDIRRIKEFYDMLKGELVMPNLTFLLRCDQEERVRRILDRGESKRDNLTEEYHRKVSSFHDMLVECEPNWHIIDTTHKSVEDVTLEVNQVISNGNI